MKFLLFSLLNTKKLPVCEGSNKCFTYSLSAQHSSAQNPVVLESADPEASSTLKCSIFHKYYPSPDLPSFSMLDSTSESIHFE